MLSPSRFTSLAQTSSWCVPFNFSPTWFSCTYSMAYSKARLKNGNHKSISLFQTILDRKIIKQMFTYMDFTI
jgi:hypothetical protein